MFLMNDHFYWSFYSYLRYRNVIQHVSVSDAHLVTSVGSGIWTHGVNLKFLLRYLNLLSHLDLGYFILGGPLQAVTVFIP